MEFLILSLVANVYPLRVDLIFLEIANSCFKSTLVNKVGDRILENKSINKVDFCICLLKWPWDAF